MVSGLRANFAKSNLFGINPPNIFLVAASHFFSCSIGSLPLKFFGILIGAIPRRASTWKPVVDKVKARLSLWKGRTLSMGGRVTLISRGIIALELNNSCPLC